jgi:Fe2+ transport system protein FeoA
MILKPLSKLRPGEQGVVERLDTADETSLKLLELGLAPGERVTFLRQAPFGGPIEIELMGYRLCIRSLAGEKIMIRCADPSPS